MRAASLVAEYNAIQVNSMNKKRINTLKPHSAAFYKLFTVKWSFELTIQQIKSPLNLNQKSVMLTHYCSSMFELVIVIE